MPAFIDNYSIIKELYKVDEANKACYERVAMIEQNLQGSAIPEDKQEEILKELEELHKLLLINEEKVKILRLAMKKYFQI